MKQQIRKLINAARLRNRIREQYQVHGYCRGDRGRRSAGYGVSRRQVLPTFDILACVIPGQKFSRKCLRLRRS